MSKIAVIGAGKTGRGFIGRLLAEAGKEILFIDKNEMLVARLNALQSFSVSFFGGSRTPVSVSNYKACTWENARLEDAELIFISVCGQNLADVGAQLSRALSDDRKYHIITCENAAAPAQTLRKAIVGKQAAVSEATVFCTTVEASGLDIESENYPYLQCNAELLEGYVPDIPAVTPIRCFSDFLTRKLYTYNAASCVIAYIGALLGYTDYGEAANDPTVLALLDRNYRETNRAMCRKFGYEPREQEAFAALSREKFCSRSIRDSIARNAREPHRKLAAGERIIGAALLLRQCAADASVLELTAAAALLYEDPSDSTWTAMKMEMEAPELLKKLSGLREHDVVFRNILAYVSRLKEDPVKTVLY